MSGQPLMTGACCPKSNDAVSQLRLSDDGRSVGIMGLNVAFEQLLATSWTPEAVTDEELLKTVRAQKNYISTKANVETTYAAALRREYATFYAQHAQQSKSP
jgi:hypothetical protein